MLRALPHLAAVVLSGALPAGAPAAGAQPAPSQSSAASRAALDGRWLVTLTPPNVGELTVRMNFSVAPDGRWRAYSRRGAVRQMVSWWTYTAGRMLGKIPGGGAALYVEDGTTSSDSGPVPGPTLYRGTLQSPVLGRLYWSGMVTHGALRAELRRDTLGAVVGTAVGVRSTDERPVREYAAIARNVHGALAEWLYDPQLVDRPEWRAFFRDLERGFAGARDDLDAMLTFYALRPRLGISHLELTRDPALASAPIDSLINRVPAPAESLAALTFPAPGVALLRVSRWYKVTPVVDRAFARIDSARPHTLIVDIRSNGGGDQSSMAPLAHLIRDSTFAGVFVGTKWYRAHRGMPTAEERARLPEHSREDALAFFHAVRESGGLTAVVPPRAPYYGGDVYLLADHASASASEPLAYVLKATHRATLVGERTAGKMFTKLPHAVGDGWVIALPEADYWTPEGTRLEGAGVEPDVAVASRQALVAVGERVAQRDPYAGAVLLGQGYTESGAWADAARAYGEAVRLQPVSATAAAGLVRALGELGQWDAAFAAADSLLARAPDEPAVLYQVGRAAAVSRQRLEQGERALRRYLEHAAPAGLPGLPSPASAHWRLGMILEARGAQDAARGEYESALRLEPQNGAVLSALRALSRTAP